MRADVPPKSTITKSKDSLKISRLSLSIACTPPGITRHRAALLHQTRDRLFGRRAKQFIEINSGKKAEAENQVMRQQGTRLIFFVTTLRKPEQLLHLGLRISNLARGFHTGDKVTLKLVLPHNHRL